MQSTTQSIEGYRGTACVGKACFSPQDIASQPGGWRSFLPTTGPRKGECRSGCQQFVPLGLAKCPTGNSSHLEPCRMPTPINQRCSHSKGEEQMLLELLGAQTNGTFLEIGGNDGFSTTNTWRLEVCHGWRGILVEGHPQLFQRMRAKRPRAQSWHGRL